MHVVVETLGNLLALHVTPADEQNRHQVAALTRQVQQAAGESIPLAHADPGHIGAAVSEQARQHGMELVAVNHAQAKRGVVLLPKRWVIEHGFARAARFRRLAKDDKRSTMSLAGLHHIAFVRIMLTKTTPLFSCCP